MNTLHGATHYSKVQVGQTKKFLAVTWNTTTDPLVPTAFGGWHLPTSIAVVQGSNRVTLTPTVDFAGRDQIEATFTDTGYVDFEVTLGTKVTQLRIEVVA